MKRIDMTPDIVRENQPIKRRKLEGGTRQIVDAKPVTSPHKSRPGVTGGTASSSSSTAKEDRKVYVREIAATPSISMAELMKRFESRAREDNATSNQRKELTLTRPKPPRLATSMRERPFRIKSSEDIELEELKKMPKFKARPFNKKIFESRGSLGLYSIKKRPETKPKEFQFATDGRIPPQTTVSGSFNMPSLNSVLRHDQQIDRITTPHPFHLETEERGMIKEQRFVEEIMHKEHEEERARIPKALPYPSSTDYPTIPPRPEPKQCTKAEPFQLESLVRHEEELQREGEYRQWMEQDEARQRLFKAQPIMIDDPHPLPEKVRIPLTEVMDVVLNVDCRAMDRAEFDNKVREKELLYKRYREECDYAKMMEEERELKQLRMTMVPHARPLPTFDNPFFPHKSFKETTIPKSPNLHVLRRKQRRNIFSADACSSPASNMR